MQLEQARGSSERNAESAQNVESSTVQSPSNSNTLARVRVLGRCEYSTVNCNSTSRSRLNVLRVKKCGYVRVVVRVIEMLPACVLSRVPRSACLASHPTVCTLHVLTVCRCDAKMEEKNMYAFCYYRVRKYVECSLGLCGNLLYFNATRRNNPYM